LFLTSRGSVTYYSMYSCFVFIHVNFLLFPLLFLHKKVRLFIIGFKSSGKTTFGKELAHALQLEFVDLDMKIEEKSGFAIPEIYKRYGEEAFRKEEAEVLKQVVGMDDVVVATGGGAACNPDNMALMLKAGLTVYLKAEDETIASRLLKVAHERPVVKGRTREEILDFVREMKKKCESYYLQAKYILEERDISAEMFAATLKKNSGL
jgi:shikimate kinase